MHPSTHTDPAASARGAARGVPPSRQTNLGLLDELNEASNQAAWQRYYDTYTALVLRVGQRHGLTPEEADDLVQDVAVHVMKFIGGYRHSGRLGAFRHWLSQQATWRALDVVRRQRIPRLQPRPERSNDDPAGDRGEVEEASVPPAAIDVDDLFRVMIRRLRAKKVSARDLDLFCAVVQDNVSAARLAEQFDMTPGAVDTAVCRVRQMARAELVELGLRMGTSTRHA